MDEIKDTYFRVLHFNRNMFDIIKPVLSPISKTNIMNILNTMKMNERFKLVKTTVKHLYCTSMNGFVSLPERAFERKELVPVIVRV